MATLCCLAFVAMVNMIVRQTGASFSPNIFPADVNCMGHHDMSSKRYCDGIMLNRNGMIYSHRAVLIGHRLGRDVNKSRNWYSDNIDCRLTVSVGAGWEVLLQFPVNIDLACSPDGTTCDCLSIYDGKQMTKETMSRRLCGPQSNVLPFVSKGSEVSLWLRTDKNCATGTGFKIQYNAVRTNTHRPCDTMEEFQCDGNRCIPRGWTCDRVAHCLDKSDEDVCSTADEMCHLFRSVTPSDVFILLTSLLFSLTVVFILCVGVYRMKHLHEHTEPICHPNCWLDFERGCVDFCEGRCSNRQIAVVNHHNRVANGYVPPTYGHPFSTGENMTLPAYMPVPKRDNANSHFQNSGPSIWAERNMIPAWKPSASGHSDDRTKTVTIAPAGRMSVNMSTPSVVTPVCLPPADTRPAPRITSTVTPDISCASCKITQPAKLISVSTAPLPLPGTILATDAIEKATPKSDASKPLAIPTTVDSGVIPPAVPLVSSANSNGKPDVSSADNSKPLVITHVKSANNHVVSSTESHNPLIIPYISSGDSHENTAVSNPAHLVIPFVSTVDTRVNAVATSSTAASMVIPYVIPGYSRVVHPVVSNTDTLVIPFVGVQPVLSSTAHSAPLVIPYVSSTGTSESHVVQALPVNEEHTSLVSSMSNRNDNNSDHSDDDASHVAHVINKRSIKTVPKEAHNKTRMMAVPRLAAGQTRVKQKLRFREPEVSTELQDGEEYITRTTRSLDGMSREETDNKSHCPSHGYVNPCSHDDPCNLPGYQSDMQCQRDVHSSLSENDDDDDEKFYRMSEMDGNPDINFIEEVDDICRIRRINSQRHHHCKT